ncbi:MAG: prepilin-type N-terminal cleavage/methylation domain-containing protein [Candidatus Marinimicrobia bacterium]|nr:prepilin-type N-terminal cleavage/methylation domain-containing protein [Candidatus Neomarinimicrobiota bacterium]MBL7046195.1 prepilin-type N-terminal cleavage/methylation domain-containing protein [Candidatus Neomarinimicrobiota bacterium]
MKIKNGRKGFTLMELVVTTAIMGTLAAVAVPSFIETQAKAKSQKSMSNISEIGSKLGQVYNELSGEYGEMDLAGSTDLTAPDTVAATVRILSESDASEATSAPYNFRDWGDIFENLPTSPFGDLEYQYYISQTGYIIYSTDDLGNVTVSVKPWQIVIFDQEAVPTATVQGLSMEFSY